MPKIETGSARTELTHQDKDKMQENFWLQEQAFYNLYYTILYRSIN